MAINAPSEQGARQHVGSAVVRRRFLKHTIYGRSPLFLRAFAYGFLRYFILLGFLDGRAGFVFHFLQGFWYRLIIDAKIYERRIDKSSPSITEPDTGDKNVPVSDGP
jgi:hypothetical protein